MTTRDVIEDVISYWDDQIEGEKIEKREIFHPVAASSQQEEITVIKGVRRAGKTFILYWLKKIQGGVYVNFEDERLSDMTLSDLDKILDVASARGSRFLYLDEVQALQGWEKFAHRTIRKAKIFVTGSNSKLLTSEYSKALTGRTKSFTVYPLSFKEFLEFKGVVPSQSTVIDYLRTGGFPRIVMTGDISLAREYFDRIIYRDVAATGGITDVDALRAVAMYLLSNVGKEFSYRSLISVSGLRHESTIKNYVGALKDAYLLDILQRYHPSLRVQQTHGKKVYSVDPAFIALGKRMDQDLGRILENVVYLHLKRSVSDLYYARNTHELDFLACQGLKPMKGVSVCLEAPDPPTLKREISQMEYFRTRMGIPIELVSLDPIPVPDPIDQRLAHRYLTG
jgi:predicted AAA+ superfamily ATPase